MPVAVKAIVDWAKAIPGCMGMAVYAEGHALYCDVIAPGQTEVLLKLLRSSPGARQASVVVGGITLVAFYAGEHIVMLKIAGRFPVLPGFSIEEPTFVDPSCAPALPSQAEARLEAETALRQFGLI